MVYGLVVSEVEKFVETLQLCNNKLWLLLLSSAALVYCLGFRPLRLPFRARTDLVCGNEAAMRDFCLGLPVGLFVTEILRIKRICKLQS